MFDFDNDMFRPIIGARLIREEAEKQASLKKPGENPVEGSVNPEPGKEIEALQVGEGALNIAPKGRNKEIS